MAKKFQVWEVQLKKLQRFVRKIHEMPFLTVTSTFEGKLLVPEWIMVMEFLRFFFPINYSALPEHLSEVNSKPSLQPLIHQVCQWLLLHL